MNGMYDTNSTMRDFMILVKQQFGIRRIIETGTFMGDGVKFFADIWNGPDDMIFSIESQKDHYDKAVKNCEGLPNATLILGDSNVDLIKVLDRFGPAPLYWIGMGKLPVMLFLDAHWYKPWPVLNELDQIASSQFVDNCLVIIDDFKIDQLPRSVCDYDSYDLETPGWNYSPTGQALDWAYVKDGIKKIFPSGYDAYTIFNPSKGRGWLVAHPFRLTRPVVGWKENVYCLSLD